MNNRQIAALLAVIWVVGMWRTLELRSEAAAWSEVERKIKEFEELLGTVTIKGKI